MQQTSSGFLDVGDGHQLWFETRGDPAGEPVLVFHGGPGSGCSPRLMDLCDPARHFVVSFDQRGAGRSVPAGSLRANTTAHLIADAERLRGHLGIPRWQATGGSWGATLALAYAAAHPAAVCGVVVRSVFLPGPGNAGHFFQGLASRHPEAWASLADGVDPAERGDILGGLHRRLHGADPARARAAARAWLAYELAIADPAAGSSAPTGAALDRLVLKFRLQSHYLTAGCFVDETAFLDACGGLAGRPVSILHGVLDEVCPPSNARQVHGRIAGSRLVLIEGCGHDPFHPAMAAAWRAALAGGDGLPAL